MTSSINFEKSFLLKDFYHIPYFYHLPKVHKSLDNSPGRPIVAAMDSVTTGLSLYIDHFLQPIVQKLQSYIRDGTHLMELLSAYRWEPTYTWLSLDVNSLYTSIPHAFGLIALEHFLAKDPLINPRQAAFALSRSGARGRRSHFHHHLQKLCQTDCGQFIFAL